MVRKKIDVEQIGWDEQIAENVSINGNLTLTGSFTQQGNQFRIVSTGSTSLFLEADTDNVTESDTSFIKMTQDGQIITSYLGHVGLNANEDPEGGTLTDSYKNALVISCYNSLTSGTDQYSRIQMATDQKVRMTISDDGNVGIGEKSPTAKLHITDATGGTLLRLDTAANQDNDPQIYITGQGEDNGEGFALNYDNDTGDIRYDVFYVSGSHIWRLYQDTDDGAGFEGMRLTYEGNLGIGTPSPTEKLDIDSDSIRIRQSKTPNSASDTGTTGQISWDSDYIYICIATNTWKRVAISTW